MLLLATNLLPRLVSSPPALESSHAASRLFMGLAPLQPWLNVWALLLLAIHVFAQWRGTPQR